MQRNCEVTVLLQLLNKYQDRYVECENKWQDNMEQLKECSDQERRSWLLEDIVSLNSQLSAYECIIKDLRGIIE